MVQTEVKPPSGSGCGAGGNRFFVALSGLAQVNMQVDESRSNDQTARIELLVGAAADLVGQSNLSNAAIAQQNIHGRVDLRRRIDHVAALDQQACGFSFLVLSTRHSVPELFRS
jgi:hypothetical protein